MRNGAAVGTPLWWVQKLYTMLMERGESNRVYDDYYRGEPPLPWLAPQAQDEFRRILRMTRSNYLGLVVDAMVERQAIEGFRSAAEPVPPAAPPADLAELEASAPESAAGRADVELWRIWQANNMDSDFDQALLEAAITGTSYLLVGPNREDPRTPHIWVEHSNQAIVWHRPGTNRRVADAGLKCWEDELTGEVYATLYLPDWIYKFRAPKPGTFTSSSRLGDRFTLQWEPRRVEDEEWPAPNPVQEVPLYELPNNPRLLTGGVSEIRDVLDVQDRINKTLADRLMTQDWGAFPQKWAAGWPDEDETGTPTAPIEVGRNRMLTTNVSRTDVAFGQFETAPLDPYSTAKREDVKDIASRTRTPAQYLLGEMANVNGDTLKASESGLVAKVRQRNRSMSDPVERAMRAVQKLVGLRGDLGVAMEVIWRNPEFRTEGELVDALVKMSTLHVPYEALWERWGASQTEIRRWKAMYAEQQRRTDLETILAERYRLQMTRAETQASIEAGVQASPTALASAKDKADAESDDDA